MTMTDAIVEVTDEIRLQRALTVMAHRIAHGSTIKAACEACNVPERTFYDWVEQGVLGDYLAQCQEARATVASTIAAEVVPDVMQYMIAIATGAKVVRGANPIAAAQFVFAAAGVKEPVASAAELPGGPTVLQFLPQMVTFNVIQGIPAVLSANVIEGEAEEVPDEKAPP